MKNNITIRMKPIDCCTIAGQPEINFIGVEQTQLLQDITQILKTQGNEILSIHDIEEKLKQQGYTHHGVYGSVIYTIYEYDEDYLLREQTEQCILPEQFSVQEEDVCYWEYHTTGLIKIPKPQ